MFQVKCRSEEVSRREKEDMERAGQVFRSLSASTPSSVPGDGGEIMAMNTVRGPSYNYPPPIHSPLPRIFSWAHGCLEWTAWNLPT